MEKNVEEAGASNLRERTFLCSALDDLSNLGSVTPWVIRNGAM